LLDLAISSWFFFSFQCYSSDVDSSWIV
jgi:hypothetical protein